SVHDEPLGTGSGWNLDARVCVDSTAQRPFDQRPARREEHEVLVVGGGGAGKLPPDRHLVRSGGEHRLVHVRRLRLDDVTAPRDEAVRLVKVRDAAPVPGQRLTPALRSADGVALHHRYLVTGAAEKQRGAEARHPTPCNDDPHRREASLLTAYGLEDGTRG